MTTLGLAMLLQHSELAETNRLILIFIVLLAIVILGMGIVFLVVAVKAMKIAKELSATAEEFKRKMLPLLDVAADVGRTSRDLLTETAPKIKVITANFVETSETLKATSRTAKSVVESCDATIADANLRAQRQVARVDGMVTVALNTTAEVVEAIGSTLKVSAHRVSGAVAQARGFAESLIGKLRARRAAQPFEEEEEPPYV